MAGTPEPETLKQGLGAKAQAKESKKNISKMKKLRNHSELKEQENSPEEANNETDLCSLTDSEFKKEIMNILNELRTDINSNTDYCRKEKYKN